ncbi:hypothetical protein [Planobispora rosea]|uniref:hypothetical protein n=1 Tax=Planobispora rosea TaxID=35762 RepID=UPI00114D10E1|nr:hypothetical protein [Planobispora rosea]
MTVLRGADGSGVVFQWVILVVSAALTGIAALAYSNANGAWQEAVRVEVAQSNAFQEQVRAIYGDEAPAAFRVALLLMQAKALEELDAENRLAASQRQVAEQTAFALQSSASPETLVHQVGPGGADVPRRLGRLIADEAAQKRLPTENPDALAVEGDTAARLGGQAALVAIIITGIAVAVASRRFPSQRGSPQGDPIELLPQPGTARSNQRRLSMLLLTLWAAAVVFPLVQMAFSAEEQRSQGASARFAVQMRSNMAISLTQSGFQTQAGGMAKEVGLYATGREIGAVYIGDEDKPAADDERAVARAEETVTLRGEEVAIEMGRDPRREDGLPPRVITALLSQEQDWKELGERQREQTDRSEFFGNLSDVAVLLIVVVAGIEGTTEWAAQRRAQSAAR